MQYAHGLTAVAMFVFIWFAVLLNGGWPRQLWARMYRLVGEKVPTRPPNERQKKFRAWYRGVALFMFVAGLGVVLTAPLGIEWDHKVFWLELLELVPFATFWTLQTFEARRRRRRRLGIARRRGLNEVRVTGSAWHFPSLRYFAGLRPRSTLGTSRPGGLHDLQQPPAAGGGAGDAAHAVRAGPLSPSSPTRSAFIDGTSGATTTYAEFERSVRTQAGGWLAAGTPARRGDRDHGAELPGVRGGVPRHRARRRRRHDDQPDVHRGRGRPPAEGRRRNPARRARAVRRHGRRRRRGHRRHRALLDRRRTRATHRCPPSSASRCRTRSAARPTISSRSPTPPAPPASPRA